MYTRRSRRHALGRPPPALHGGAALPASAMPKDAWMLIAWALLLLELRPAVAFTTAPRAPYRVAAPLQLSRTVAPPALAANDDDDKVAAALATIKDAGIAGVAYVVYHGTTGEWLQLQDLLSDGEGRVRLVGIILSYIVLLKTLFPLRLGATLFLTPRMKSFLGGLGLTEQG